MTPTVENRRLENLALHFQEVLTAIERLRGNRQGVTDANAFRHHTREALKTAAGQALAAGYTPEDVKYATYATVAFLDESVLNSRSQVFADWARKPLQEEMFGTQIAGEVFFQHLQQLLGRNDSADLADLLEVYYLCLLLGFGGRYSVANRGELGQIMSMTAAKIYRVRARFSQLSPAGTAQGRPAYAQGPVGAKARHHCRIRGHSDGAAVRGLQSGTGQRGPCDGG